ncbi:MAG: LuxR C-terminal-related transcriptional regulator [Acidimicrobiales bacterium]
MTPQQARVARLVASGVTNRDVAAQLFISPATITTCGRCARGSKSGRERSWLERCWLGSNKQRRDGTVAQERPLKKRASAGARTTHLQLSPADAPVTQGSME